MSTIGDCNIFTENLDTETIIDNNLGDLSEDLKVIGFAQLSGGNLNLLRAANGGAESSSTWFTEKQRLSDGFLFTINFNINDGGEDGFAFLVQNDRIQDIGGGGGANLGFKNKLQRSLAVAIDTCVERADSTCNSEKVSVLIQQAGSQTAEVLAEVQTGTADGQIDFDIKSTDVRLEIAYLANVGEKGSVIVRLNGVEFVDVQLPVSLLELFEDEFAFMGFTASNGLTDISTVVIKDFSLRQMNSGTLLSEDSFIPKTNLAVNSVVLFSLSLVDSCNLPLPSENAVVQDFTTDRISAVLSSNNLENQRTLFAEVASDGSSTFTLSFALEGDIANWDLTVEVDGILSQRNPVRNIISSDQPAVNGLSPASIGLLVAALLVGLIAAVFMVRGLNRYRQKLNEHDDDIKVGKLKSQLDEIDTTIMYNVNPMVVPLEELEATLKKNLAAIEDLKKQQENAMDSEFEIEQLRQKNIDLRRQMAEIHRENELNAAGNRISIGFDRVLGGKANGRQDFDQERA